MTSNFLMELEILENILNDHDEIVDMDYIIGESEGSFSLEQSPAEGSYFLCSSPSVISELSTDL